MSKVIQLGSNVAHVLLAALERTAGTWKVLGSRISSPGRGGALPSNMLMGMCRWMGLHFHDWIDYNGVAFSIGFRIFFFSVIRLGTLFLHLFRLKAVG